MLAAAAAADFTPEPGPVLQGHGGAPPSHRVLHPLEVRSIVFADGDERVAVCTADVVGVSADLTRRVRGRAAEACGVPGDHLMIAASHTHCAPPAIRCLGMVPDAAFMAALEQAMVASLVEAASRLEPVTLGLGCGSASFNINRRRPQPPNEGGAVVGGPHPGGLVDRRARVLRVDRADGSPLAVLFHYSCHPVTKTGMQGIISADYPGVARAQIERALGGHALFMPGCFGDVRPAVLNPETGGFGDATDEQLLAFGRELGGGVVKAAGYTRTAPSGGLSAAVTPLEVEYGDVMPAEEMRRMAAAEGAGSPVADVGARWAKRVMGLLERNEVPVSVTGEVQALRIGPLVCIAVSGEVVQAIGHAIEKTAAPAVGADDVWAMGYANDMIGYLVTERQKLEGGYEPRAYVHFEHPAPFRDEHQVILETVGKLLPRVSAST